jgi:hypothetical protein
MAKLLRIVGQLCNALDVHTNEQRTEPEPPQAEAPPTHTVPLMSMVPTKPTENERHE